MVTEFAPIDGNVHTKLVDHGKEGAMIVREQYVGDIVENCTARRNEGYHGFKDFRLMASIPPLIIENYCTVTQVSFREFMNNPEHIRRIVNDSTYSVFRIAPGRM